MIIGERIENKKFIFLTYFLLIIIDYTSLPLNSSWSNGTPFKEIPIV